MIPYIPRRDARFEYAEEACNFIEERQCSGCIHAVDPEPDMLGGGCGVLIAIVLEQKCENILGEGIDVEDLGSEGIRCTRAFYGADE